LRPINIIATNVTSSQAIDFMYDLGFAYHWRDGSARYDRRFRGV